MAFTIYGPGTQDPIPLSNLDKKDRVEPIQRVAPVQERSEQDESDLAQAQQQLVKKFASKAYEETREMPGVREPAIRAHQIMSSPVISLPYHASILKAWNLFREKRFRSIPILASSGRIVGILSDRDLLRYAAVNGKVPPFNQDSELADSSIESLVQHNVITATPDSEIREVARVMFERRIGVMPIVDSYGNLIGVITRSDILRTLVHNAPLELWV